ncbi:Hypothetical protein A7982_09756 [Minicystis rosea]|nr:Hypothetical protein A7982_09756 [Minicystis rosea]
MPSRFFRPALAFVTIAVAASSCVMDQATPGLRRTPSGPGAVVRFDLAHQPLPDIPLPNDTATWPDPTSRTGLRVNASLVAPTAIERQARDRFSRMEGWGTFAPITVGFDVDRDDAGYADYQGTALDLANIVTRHRGDDYEFADDAVYLVNLTTGVPVPLDLGAGNFDYTLKKLDSYWANDTRITERNLLFETVDETKGGAITKATFRPADDTDFDGTLDQPNLDDPSACPAKDPVCDDASNPDYGTSDCLDRRRVRDRCITDHLLTWYERETDTLILRPVLPLDEMTRYAVVVTDRVRDGRGNAVKSPFDYVYHVSQEPTARRVQDIVNDKKKAAYFGDIAGTGLDHVAFTWSFTTQPTVSDLKLLRDGLYGQGPFARWAKQYPPELELSRAVGLVAGVTTGDNTDPPDWKTSADGVKAHCPEKQGNLFVIKYADIREQMKVLLTQGFGLESGPGSELLLKAFENVDHMLVGTYKAPFLLEGGPKGTDPNASFNLNYQTGEGEETEDTVQVWMVVPKETAEHKQPFNVNIYGHGYTGNFAEMLFYSGNMAQHGIATVGINAMGHGFVIDDALTQNIAKTLLGQACVGPFFDAIVQSRARDLNEDGVPDSGGDFWSSYLFHTRDGVRQSVLDHIQLVRILRAFGTDQGRMFCRSDATGWTKPADKTCDLDGDGKANIAGDFDGNGVPDLGGPNATYGTWGESLGGILSGIHGAVDAFVTTAVPGSGGGGLTDIGVRSFQGGVVEAVLLRIWGPLLVTIPAGERQECTESSTEHDRCTVCDPSQLSLRWVMPDLNDTGELEIGCHAKDDLANTTVIVNNLTNNEVKCASVNDAGRVRIGLPTSLGDKVRIDFFTGRDQVESYASCVPTFTGDTKPKVTVTAYGKGPYPTGTTNEVMSDSCDADSCGRFQGRYYPEGGALVAPAEGFGEIRQTPALRRFLQLAQMALDPGDPVSFAPYYSIKPMTDPSGKKIAPHAVLTLNTIGDMNVPLNSGIAFARATGALPFMRPDQVARYPEYADYATPDALFAALDERTPNQVLINNHVIEGIAALARTPAEAGCATSQNAKDADATFSTADGAELQCFPTGCKSQGKSCYYDTHCDEALDRCVPNALGQQKCDEALYDVDDLDEGLLRYFEKNARVPLRLARFTQAATPSTIGDVWAPRVLGKPFGKDLNWTPSGKPLTALLDAYIVPQGVHTFVNGEPCQSFDHGTYLTNLTARFFMTNGADLYYLSHPNTHRCLQDAATCDYLQ